MPLFDFKCPECDHELEALVHADAAVVCPQCGEHMHKQLSAPGMFVLKGDGFYKPGNNL